MPDYWGVNTGTGAALQQAKEWARLSQCLWRTSSMVWCILIKRPFCISRTFAGIPEPSRAVNRGSRSLHRALLEIPSKTKVCFSYLKVSCIKSWHLIRIDHNKLTVGLKELTWFWRRAEMQMEFDKNRRSIQQELDNAPYNATHDWNPCVTLQSAYKKRKHYRKFVQPRKTML